jgi:hypothetical protein
MKWLEACVLPCRTCFGVRHPAWSLRDSTQGLPMCARKLRDQRSVDIDNRHLPHSFRAHQTNRLKDPARFFRCNQGGGHDFADGEPRPLRMA